MRRLPRNNVAAVTALQRSLEDPDKSVQLPAALALTTISTDAPTAVPAYMKLFQVGGPGFQRIAIDGLAGFEANSIEAIPMLMDAATAADTEMRRLAV